MFALFSTSWGWDRTENGMPLPLKQSPLTGHADAASYAPLQCLAATLWNMNWLQVDLIPKFIMASGDLAQRWDEKGLAGPQCIDIALHSGIGIQAERRRRREIREILWAEVKILLKTRVSRYLEFRTETLEDFWELSSFCAWWGYTSAPMMLPLCDFLTLMYMLCLCNWNSDK